MCCILHFTLGTIIVTKVGTVYHVQSKQLVSTIVRKECIKLTMLVDKTEKQTNTQRAISHKCVEYL